MGVADAHNRAFTLFGLPVYWYGIIMATAVVLAVVVSWAREEKLGLPKETTLNLTLLMLPIGLVCARAYYVAFSWESYSANPLSVFNVREGGMAIYGGLIGGMLTAAVYSRAKRVQFARVLDLFAPGVALAQAIGRWGNFMNQEAFGAAVLNPALQWFPLSVFIQADQTWHLATFFYESAWCLITFIVLMALERAGKLRRPGDGFLTYLLMYGFERAIVEGLRTDSLMLGPIRVSQWLSALLALAALGVLIYRKQRARRRAWEDTQEGQKR